MGRRADVEIWKGILEQWRRDKVARGTRSGIDKGNPAGALEQGESPGAGAGGIMTELKKPTIHLNGTSRRELQANFEMAYRGLGDVIRLVQNTCPNGRDYYPQEAGAITRAQDQHEWRLRQLETIRAEMLQLFAHCEEGK